MDEELDSLVIASNENIREFVCGWGAAFINVVITYPINKVMFRQMLHGVETQQALDQLKLEGMPYLYRGILPPLIQKTCSVSLMFGMYDHSCTAMTNLFPTMPTSVCKGSAAIIAGTVEALLTPFERLQTLMQDSQYHKRYRNTMHAAVEMRKLGIREYYRGLSPILVRNGPSNMMFFGFRNEIRSFLPDTDLWLGQIAADFVSGALIGALISTVFYPINVVKTRMQVTVGGEFPSMIQSFRIIYNERDKKWSRLFFGVHINYTRALISWGIINASYELLKKILPAKFSW